MKTAKAGRRWLIAGLVLLGSSALIGVRTPFGFPLGLLASGALYGFLIRRAGVSRVATFGVVTWLLLVLIGAIPGSTRLALLFVLANGSTSTLVLMSRRERTLIVGLIATIVLGFGTAWALLSIELGVLVAASQVVTTVVTMPGRPSDAINDPSRRRA